MPTSTSATRAHGRVGPNTIHAAAIWKCERVGGGDGMNDQRVLSAAVTIVLLALLTTSCGGGGGGKNRNFELPAGTAFDTTRSGRVLVAVETHNECDDDHECAAATS